MFYYMLNYVILIKIIVISKYTVKETSPITYHFKTTTQVENQLINNTHKPKYHFNISINNKIFEDFICRRQVEEDNIKYTIQKNTSSINGASIDLYEEEEYLLNDPYNTYEEFMKNNYFYGRLNTNQTLYYKDEFSEMFNTSNNEKCNALNSENMQSLTIIITDRKMAALLKTESAKLIEMGRKELFKQFATFKETGRTCPLAVFLDDTYINIFHDGDIKAADNHLRFIISEADSVFRSTDFDEDGIPDNIGLNIMYVEEIPAIYTDITYPVDPIPFMNAFAIGHSRPRACVGVLFTAQKFLKGVIGISNLGGICANPTNEDGGEKRQNSVVVTTQQENVGKLPQLFIVNTLIHELGHSFGAPHDDNDCPDYIMRSSMFEDYSKRDHFVFSKCSKVIMMATLLIKGQCFIDVPSPFCGNGLVEDGEDCDCGMTLDCLQNDPCCTPRGTDSKNECKVNTLANHECHPSQGPCCTPQCKINNLKDIGLECKDLQERCLCEDNTARCPCGVNAVCIENRCSNIECSRLNLAECSCSENNMQACQTCCRYKVTLCLPASDVTDKIISDDDNLFQTLLREYKSGPPPTNESYGFRKNFCRNNDCVTLLFRSVKSGQYCLSYGEIGLCDNSFNCNVNKTRIFPNFNSSPTRILPIHFECIMIVMLRIIYMYFF